METLIKITKGKTGYNISTTGDINDLINALAAATVQVENSIESDDKKQAFRIDYLKKVNYLRTKELL